MRPSSGSRRVASSILLSAALAAHGFGQPALGAGQPELLLQYGHAEDIVGTPSFSPDGKLVATMDGSREVIVWDLESGRQLRRLRPAEPDSATDYATVAHSKAVISPDGKLLAASGRGEAVIWELESGRRRPGIVHSGAVMKGHAPEDIVFSPDGRLLYMADSFGNVIPHDVATGSPLRQFERTDFYAGHELTKALAASADGRLLAAAGRKFLIEKGQFTGGRDLHWARVIDAATGKELALLENVVKHLERNPGRPPQPSSVAVAVAFSPDGRLLALGGEGVAWVYETAGWRELYRVDMKDDVAAGIAFSTDGRVLAISGSPDYSVRLVNARTGELEKVLANPRTVARTTHIGGYSKVAFSPDGRKVIATGSRGSLRIWDLASGESVGLLGGRTDSITRIAASRDGKKVAAAGSQGGLIRVWNLDSGTQGATVDLHKEVVSGVAFTADGRYGISWGGSDAKLWDPATGAGIRGFEHRNPNRGQPWDHAKCGKAPRTEYSDLITRVAVSGDSRYLATAGYDCTLRLWDMASGKELRRIDGLFDFLAVSNDGRWLAARYQEIGYPLRIWEIATGRELSPLPDVSADILAFNEKNQLLVSLKSQPPSLEKPVVVWDVEQRREIARYAGINTNILTNSWSFDGEQLAAFGLFGRVGVLDSRSGKRVDPPRPLRSRGSISGIALVPGGCCVVLSSDTGELALFDRRTGELLATMVSVRDDGDWLRDMEATGRPWSGEDWLVVTPDGLFDGPPSAFNKLLWRFSDALEDVAPAEVFFNEFYRPGLLADIMAGRRPTAPRDIAQLDRRQPRVELRVPAGPVAQRTIAVKIRVSEIPSGGARGAGSGARDVRLFRNGSLVRAWRGDVLSGKGASTELEANVTLVAGENRFTAYAFNRDNVKSADAVATVEGGPGLRRGGTAWVLAVGVNRYANSGFDLRYAVADAEAFTQELARAQQAIGAYERVQTVILRDGEATKANVLAALRRLAGQEAGPPASGLPAALAQLNAAQPEDAVFVFFAGHGFADEPRFYLVPHDLGYSGDPEKMSDAAFKAMLTRSISDIEIEQVLERLDAGRLILVIDACQSGQALEAEERRRGPMNSRGLAQLAYEKGMYVLTAAQGHQAALEFAAVGHGLLTHALIEEGLKAGAADQSPRDGRILVREWLDYAGNAVPRTQLRLMQEASRAGRSISVVDGEQKIPDVLKRRLQQPRVFYRREPERDPFVVARRTDG